MQRKNQRNSKQLSHKVRRTVRFLAPSARGLPPQRLGERALSESETLSLGMALSLRPFGAPPSQREVDYVLTFFMMSLHISFRCWSRLMFSSIVLMEYTTVE